MIKVDFKNEKRIGQNQKRKAKDVQLKKRTVIAMPLEELEEIEVASFKMALKIHECRMGNFEHCALPPEEITTIVKLAVAFSAELRKKSERKIVL